MHVKTHQTPVRLQRPYKTTSNNVSAPRHQKQTNVVHCVNMTSTKPRAEVNGNGPVKEPHNRAAKQCLTAQGEGQRQRLNSPVPDARRRRRIIKTDDTVNVRPNKKKRHTYKCPGLHHMYGNVSAVQMVTIINTAMEYRGNIEFSGIPGTPDQSTIRRTAQTCEPKTIVT